MLEPKKLDELFSLLKEMTQRRTSNSKLAPPLNLQRFEKYSTLGFLFTALVLLVLAVVLVALQQLGITPPQGFYCAVLIVNFILLVLSIVCVMTMVATAWWDGKQYFPAMLTALKNDLHHDEKFITRLWKLDKETLAYGLLQYRHRWSLAESRVALIAGDLRKLGLFPAIAALLISAATLREDSNAIVLVSVIVTAILYLLRLLQNSLDAQNLFHVQRREKGLGAAIAGMM